MGESEDVRRDGTSQKPESNEQIEPKLNWKQENTAISAYLKRFPGLREVNLLTDRRKLYTLTMVMGCLSATAMSFTGGVSLAYTSSLFPALLDPDSDIQTTAEQNAWLASSGSLSAPIGAAMGALLMERFGRLATVQLSVVPLCTSWIVIATANSFVAILIGRVLIGAMSTMAASSSGVLIAETALKAHRGALSSLGLSLAALGVLCGYILGTALHWRTFAWVAISAPLLAFILTWVFTAESPLWLRTRGRMKTAQKTSLYYYNDPHYVVQAAVPRRRSTLTNRNDGNSKQIEPSQASSLSQFRMLMTLPSGLKPLAIITIMFFLQNLSGVYIIMVNAVPFFQAAGSAIDPYIASIFIGVVKFITSLFQIFLLRHCGRRFLMLVGSLLMAACMTASAYATSLTFAEREGGPKSFFPVWFIVACVVTHQLGASIGIQAVPWTMSAELFPQQFRGMAQSFNYVSFNIFMFGTLQAYPWMLTHMGGAVGIQYFFAAVSLLAAVFTLIFLPETHKKSLTEIEEYFVHNIMYLGSKKQPK